MLALDRPAVLLLLVLCVPPLLGRGATWTGYSSLRGLPADAASRGLDFLLRGLAALCIAALVLGLAGLHRPLESVERTGRGAHIVLVLDRSLSMDEPFALAGQKARETKTAAASRVIEDFFDRRPHDSFGLVAFSTSPILAMPITAHREAARAALAAMRQKGLANTDFGGALALALSMFARDSDQATRVILFVSDGAALMDRRVQQYIRTEVPKQHVHIYYLYLRTGDDPPLSEDQTGRNDRSRPAWLDGYFASLGVPYRGFEAREPGAIAAATATIDTLETRPVTYREMVARVGYEGACYALACVCLLLVLLARLAERDLAPAVTRRS